MKKIVIWMVGLSLLICLSACTDSMHEVKFIIDDSMDDVVVEVEDGDIVERIDDPILENYQFLGWYTSKSFDEKFDFDQEITEDVTLYARFSHFELGQENYIAFKEDGHYGFMLPTGEVVVEAKYDKVEPLRYGYAWVSKNGEASFIDVLGNELSGWHDYTPGTTIGYMQFTEDGITNIYKGNGITEFMDRQGRSLFEIVHSENIRVALDAYFADGRLPVVVHDEEDDRDECVYYDKHGNIVLTGDYLSCSIFSDGLAGVRVETGSPELGTYRVHYVFINPQGEILFETEMTELYTMFDGIKPVIFKDGYTIGKISGRLGISQAEYVVIDDQGHVVIEFDDDIPVDVNDGYILTKNNEGYYAIFDFTGNKILDYFYQGDDNPYHAIAISDDMVVLRNEQDEYGAIDVSSGDIVIDFEYDELMTFIDGYAVAKKNGYFGIIDGNNQVIVDFIYEDMFSVARTLLS